MRLVTGLVLAALVSLSLMTPLAFPPASLAQDIVLPPPQTDGGLGLFEALKKRSSVSGAAISPAEVTLEELSTVLWAASGLNRGQTGWTVPMAEGLAPYVRVFVAGPGGVWLYDWAAHKLIEISKENVKAGIAAQAFVAKAWYSLIFVSDKKISAGLGPGAPAADNFIQVLTGAMTQDVYLAAAALGLGSRYIH